MSGQTSSSMWWKVSKLGSEVLSLDLKASTITFSEASFASPATVSSLELFITFRFWTSAVPFSTCSLMAASSVTLTLGS